MRALNSLFNTLLYPLYAPLYALLMLYFTATPYAVLPTENRLFIFGTVLLYTVLVPKPLVYILSERFHVRMNRWRTHAIYITSQILCYTTLMKIEGAQPLLYILEASIICEVILPLLGGFKNSVSMTLGMLLSFVILINFVGDYKGSLFTILVVAILITGYLCTVQFGYRYTKRRHVLSSLIFGALSFCIALFI